MMTAESSIDTVSYTHLDVYKRQPQGSATLENAQFTVKYYAGLGEANKDPATLGKTPARTWVFKTDKDGFTMYRCV